MADTVKGVKELTSAIQSLTKEVDKLAESWKSAGKAAASGVSGAATNASRFSTNILGGLLPNSMSSGNSMGLGLAAVSSTGPMGKVVGAALGLGSFTYSALPSLDRTLGISAGYYGAARFGGVSRAGLERQTLGALQGGVSSPEDAAAAAAYLSQGYNFKPGSTAYMQIMREVGGAAKYLNIPNAAAAQALGGFSAGAGIAGSLYSMGISTYNAKTGQPRTFAEISKQIYNRFFPTGGSPDEIRQSLSMGMAGGALRSGAFGDSTQQAMLAQAFVDIASGRNPDLAKAGNLAGAQGAAGNANPIDSFYRMQGSQASLYARAEQPMLDGFAKAATAVEVFNKALEGLPDAIYEFKGALQGFGGSNLGGGLDILGTGLAYGAGMLMGGRRGGGKVTPKTPTGSQPFGSPLGKSGRGIGARGVGVGLVGSLAGQAIAATSSKGSVQSKLGMALSWGSTGAMLGSFLGPEGTAAGALIGGGLGAIAGLFMGGGESGFSAAFSANGKGGPTGVETQAPISGVSITATFGEKGSLWKSGQHTGQDYGAPEGTPVKAIADGTVLPSNSGEAYGTNVVIDHGGGYTSLYGHLSAKLVNVGDKISRGQVIGRVGQTGNATGPHLHLEVRKDGHAIDPSQFLQGSVSDANPSAAGAKGSEGSSVASAVLGNAPGVDLSGGYSVVSSLFDGSIKSTMDSSDPMGTGSKATGAGLVLGTGDQQGWAKRFLNSIGAPLSDENIKAMTTWMAYEGGHWKNSAHYNPLNTTQPEDGATSMNSVGVKSYNSWEQGLQATVQTIKNGRYANILSALMRGDSAQSVISAVNDSPWGTHIRAGGPANQHVTASAGGPANSGVSISGVSGGGVSRSVVLNVYPQGASDEDAKMLAKRVKAYLEHDNEIKLIGSK